MTPSDDDAAPGMDLAAFDSRVHHPARLGILTVLAAVERVTFGYLKDTLELTDGNLSRNLTVLEEAGFVAIAKGHEGRRPRTWVQATKHGRAALAEELAALQALTSWRPPDPSARTAPPGG